jgi:mono/diheme cytochrome c family protein
LAVGGGAIWRPLAQLRRGAILETGLGIGVLAVVGVLGILPPGLHTQPGWPLPFRIDVAALDLSSTVAVASLAAVAAFCAIGAMAAAAAGRYRIMLVLGAEFALCAALGWLPLRGVVEQAYPTSFYAPAEAYDAASVVRGQAVFAANCTACHGANGRGDGPAAAGLPVRPANLTESHLFAHTPGDLFWWISRGRHDGAMPGFANSLSAGRRWDAINFIRARAAGDLVQQIGPQVSAEDTYPVPDFSFASGRVQQTLNRTLLQGPMLVVLYDGEHPPLRRLGTPAAARARLAAAGLRAIAIDLGEAGSHASAAPLAVAASPAGIAALSLFRSPNDGGESELLLDRNGTVRARWTAAGSAGLPGMEALAAAAARAARIPVSPPSHGGHAH